jgi:signal transduction histidine kinase
MTDSAASALREHAGKSELQTLATHLGPLVRGLQTGILLVNVERTVLIANEALISQLGVGATPADLVGASADEVLRLRTRPIEDYRELDVFIRDCVEHGEPRHGVELPLGSDQTVEVDFIPIRAGAELLGRLWGIRNATERTEVRRMLVRRNEELTRLATLKTEFLTTLAHELRTPLTALTGLTELFATGVPGSGEDTAITEAVSRNVQRMTALVETLLLLARVESRSLALTTSEVDLTALLRRQSADAKATADSLSVRLRLIQNSSSPAVINGDEKLLSQALCHALTSVISGSGAGSTVDVRVETNSEANSWTTEIVNRRPLAGADAFLFTRPPHPDDGSPTIGSGLGIALARAISERHGGTVIVKPTEDGDHIVRIELPLGRLPATEQR